MNNLYEEFGYPFVGQKLTRVKSFLADQELDYEEQISFTVNLIGDQRIVATGSLDGNILKCIAVDPEYQGEGLASRIVQTLISEGYRRGLTHLFLYTKPENIRLFQDLGFYLITETTDVALMENQKDGISNYLNTLYLAQEGKFEDNGSVVMNCNPFTNGHLYLIEEAASQSDCLYVFVVSEDRSVFPADVRLDLVKRGVAHLDNVVVYPTSDYLISAATFPTYFLKDRYESGDIQSELDLIIFAEYFVKTFQINKRFVGTEPLDRLTASYNEKMKEILNEVQVEVLELPRKLLNEVPISASRVRELMAEGDYDAIRELVPDVTYDFLVSEEGLAIAKMLRKDSIKAEEPNTI